MIAKYLRFNNIFVSTTELMFKGFVIKKNNTILDVNFNIVNSPLPIAGLLSQLIINSGTDFATIPTLIFNDINLLSNKDDIVIEFTNEIDFDNIQCVCGPNKDNHFKSIRIDYSTDGVKWKVFNKPSFIPSFSVNDIGIGNDFYCDFVSISNTVNRFFKNSITISDKRSSAYSYNLRSFEKIKTGKHFVEVTMKNTNRTMSSAWCAPIGIAEVEYATTEFTNTGARNYQAIYRSTGSIIERLFNNASTILQTFGTGTADAQNWEEQTIGFFIDLDLNKIKTVINGVNQSNWHNIIKTKPTQEFYIFTQIRNMGLNSEFSINYPPKYTYTDLTPVYKQDHFKTHDGWVKREFVSLKVKDISSIDLPYTLNKRGLLNIKNEDQGLKTLNYTTHHYIPADIPDNLVGYGYFKSTVEIDYPPREPISKKVQIYSINDNKVLQQVWSDALTGQYEFKNLIMKQPYLIYTFDDDEDYNSAIVGPVYPTLMPEFEGLDLTLIE